MVLDSATRVRISLCAVLAAANFTLASEAASGPASAGPASAGKTVLSQKHFWRKHYTFFPPSLSAKAAKALGLDSDRASRTEFLARHFYSGFETPPPPEQWRQPDYDDAAWLLERGRQFVCGDSRAMKYNAPDATNAYLRGTDPFVEEVGLICQRGRFIVKDPAKVGKLLLSLVCRGGFVAYLNGTEVARAWLPAGRITPFTPAAEYPLEAFFLKGDSKNRQPLQWYTHRGSDQWALRERSFGPVPIDTGLLREGVNVLAIELHRAEYPAECKRKVNWRTRPSLVFATLGLSLLELRAEPAGDAVAPASTRRGGLDVWPADIAGAYSDRTCPNHDYQPAPVRIVAARNGSFAGQAIVASDSPIEGLTAAASALVHTDSGARIPRDRIRIRYGAVNPTWRGGLGYLTTVLPQEMKLNSLGNRFDILLADPPSGTDCIPVWITVDVPRDASAGDYGGAVSITVNGHDAVRMPIDLYVADWSLPDVEDQVSLLNIYQSPETLARYYQVEPWSQRHWRLIERSLEMMGEIGNMGLFFPLLAESQMGNPESMVIWVKQPDGSYKYDFSRFDRYLDTAMKYHRRLRFLSLNVWGRECSPRGGYENARGALVTVQDARTGERTNVKLPEYGTAECEKLWRPLLLALRDRLKARGLDELILLGLPADGAPHWSHVAMFRRILPEAKWIRESHFDTRAYRYDPKDKQAVVPVAYNSVVWGGSIPDPRQKRLYGWRQNPDHLIMNFNRAGTECLVLNGFPPPWSYRMWMESTLACGRNGNGRVGGDYWHIGAKFIGGGRANSEAVGGSSGTLFGIYLASCVGQVGLGNSTTDLFGPGPNGPVPTVRLENAREGIAEAEARIFIEKALLDKDSPLPAELAKKCQDLLDKRTNVLRMWAIGAARIAPYLWQQRARRLYDAAGEVKRALARSRPGL